jgi:hypothetical protein
MGFNSIVHKTRTESSEVQELFSTRDKNHKVASCLFPSVTADLTSPTREKWSASLIGCIDRNIGCRGKRYPVITPTTLLTI